MSHVRIAAAYAAVILLAQPDFRSSLTATVNLLPDRTAGETTASRLARPVSAVGGLRCRHVSLRWRARRGARRYVVFVSVRGDGPWTPLPPTNVCGDVRPDGPTGVVDVEPAGGAPAVARRLYYKVFALAEAEAPPLDVTNPVAVALP